MIRLVKDLPEQKCNFSVSLVGLSLCARCVMSMMLIIDILSNVRPRRVFVCIFVSVLFVIPKLCNL